MVRHACSDHVPRTRKPHAGDRIATAGHHEPAHLGQAARHEERRSVVAEPKPVGHAHGNRDHILESGAQLHPARVLTRIGAERLAREQLLEKRCRIRRFARNNRGSGNAAHHFLGVVGPRKHGKSAAITHLGVENVDGEKPTAFLDALRAHDDGEVGVDHVGQGARRPAHERRGRHDNGRACAQQCIAI